MKFQAVAEKTAKDARELLYFAAPCTVTSYKKNSQQQNDDKILNTGHKTYKIQNKMKL